MICPFVTFHLGGNQLTGCLLIERWRNVNYSTVDRLEKLGVPFCD